MEKAVSNPDIPGAPFSLSSLVCGAWSVAIVSTVPSFIPFIIASTSSFFLIGGFTL